MVNILLQANSADDLKINALVFYKTMTQKINLIKSIEDRQSQELLNSVKQTKHKVSKSFYEMLIINIILVIFISILGIIVIADQTNLLALNAAIEVARAGEHGRGFAVCC